VRDRKCETGEERGSDSNGGEKREREGPTAMEGGFMKPRRRNVKKERGEQTIKHCLPVCFPTATVCVDLRVSFKPADKQMSESKLFSTKVGKSYCYFHVLHWLYCVCGHI